MKIELVEFNKNTNNSKLFLNDFIFNIKSDYDQFNYKFKY